MKSSSFSNRTTLRKIKDRNTHRVTLPHSSASSKQDFLPKNVQSKVSIDLLISIQSYKSIEVIICDVLLVLMYNVRMSK